MITAVNFRPKYYSSGYNPIIWSVTSDKANPITNPTLYDFSYVFDIYINGAMVNRVIQRPNPAYAGMIDVSAIVSSYLEVGKFANESFYNQPPYTEYPTLTNLFKPYKTGTTAVCNIKVNCGEQYRVGTSTAALNIYTGTTNNIGNPSYVLGAQGFPNSPVVVLPSSLNWNQQQETLQVQQNTAGTDYFGLFGYLAPFIPKNDGIVTATTCGGNGLFISNYPRTNTGGAWQKTSAAPPNGINADVLIYDRYTLTFLNRNPYYESLGGTYLQQSSPKVAWFLFYDAEGTELGHYAAGNFEIFGGAPRVTCGDVISAYSTSINQEFISLRVGPRDLEDDGIISAFDGACAYYTVQLFANWDVISGCTYSNPPYTALSELATFNIVEDCLSTLYPRVRLSFLNQYGAHDYWNFTVFAEETVDAASKNYYQPEVDWSSLTPVKTSGDQTQNWLKGGSRHYNRIIKNHWTITSDYLTQEQVNFLQNLVLSPQVWFYVGEDDFPYTCTIKETSYTTKTIKQVKLFTATFNVEVSTDRTMQTV